MTNNKAPNPNVLVLNCGFDKRIYFCFNDQGLPMEFRYSLHPSGIYGGETSKYQIDVRDLPDEYAGRSEGEHYRNVHLRAFIAAFEDGYDLHAHARRDFLANNPS